MNNKYKSAEDYIKVPLQSKWYNGRRVYAYLRRSTSKEEQSESLLQQEEWITFIASQLGIEIKEIVFFEETRSGFENRSRPEWKKLLKAVDMSPEWAIILCRDTSRLSRNPRDNMEIADRIFGDNKKKKKIISIFFLSGNQLQEWNERSDKKYIVDKLHQNYTESIETKQKSLSGIILKLQQGLFPYATPKGIEKYKMPDGRNILCQNEKMQFVRYAFEMKTQGKSHKNISKYLRSVGIKISEKELSERLFKNTIYIGEYTEKNTGEIFTNIIFKEWKPPISKTLWNEVQATFKKRISQYGEKFEWDILAGLLKTESGRVLSPYFPSGKTAKQYKNTSEKINISERKILKKFLEVVRAIILEWWKIYNVSMIDKLLDYYGNNKVNEKTQKHLNDLYERREFFASRFYEAKDANIHKDIFNLFMTQKANAHKYETIKVIVENTFGDDFSNEQKEQEIQKMLQKDAIIMESSLDIIREKLKETPVFKEKISIKQLQDKEVIRLKKELEKIQKDKMTLKKKLVMNDFSKEEIDEMMEGEEKKIYNLEKQIEEFSEWTEYDVFLRELPNILSEIFELSISVLGKEENEEKKENILRLLEMTAFELSVDNKKELKIKLFEVIETLLKGGLSDLEAPAGVEPASKALQASV